MPCFEFEGNGCTQLADETSLVQLTSAVMHGSLPTQAPPAAPPSLAVVASTWLQALQTERLETLVRHQTQTSAGSFVIIVVVAVAVLALWCIFYVCVLSTEGVSKLEKDDIPQRQLPKPRHPSPGTTTPPPPVPRDISQANRPSLGGHSEQSGSGAVTPISGTRVPAGGRSILAIPTMQEITLEPFKSFRFKILDSFGKGLLDVDMMQPPPDISDGDQWTPAEYLTLHSVETAEEMAMCALGPGTGGSDWECHVFRGDNELYGYIVEDRGLFPGVLSGEVKYKLVSMSNETVLTVKGSFDERRLEVLEGETRIAVMAEGDFRFCRPKEYNKVTCFPDADVGLVVLVLLGVDRMLPHRRRW
mmetsp:Transcript_24402/g.69979  ORF Transcript_24402/g.69979 Transcript_24402/m.69979 type:complete len:360 (-) Transcript_24402:59-1138(-)